MVDVSIIRPHLRTRGNQSLPPNVLCIGITGGMGSGKSTVAQFFAQKGWAVVDLDKIARQLTEPNGAAIKPLIQAFGNRIITSDGIFDRALMRTLAFDNPQIKKALEKILHPMIRDAAIIQAQEQAQSRQNIIFDIPLLTESEEWQKSLDWIIVVDCPRETQIERVKLRNPELSQTTIEEILNQQASREARLLIADAVVDNSPQNTVENRNKHLHLYIQFNTILNNLQKYQKERL